MDFLHERSGSEFIDYGCCLGPYDDSETDRTGDQLTVDPMDMEVDYLTKGARRITGTLDEDIDLVRPGLYGSVGVEIIALFRRIVVEV